MHDIKRSLKFIRDLLKRVQKSEGDIRRKVFFSRELLRRDVAALQDQAGWTCMCELEYPAAIDVSAVSKERATRHLCWLCNEPVSWPDVKDSKV